MATYTKFYLNRGGNQVRRLTANYGNLPGSWNSFSSSLQQGIHPLKLGSAAPTTQSSSESVATNPYKFGLFCGITPPIKAQTISGTVNAVIGMREANADADFYFRLHVVVFAADGSIRGTLLNGYEEDTPNEFATTSTGQALASAQTLSSLACESGDRIGFFLGAISRNSHTTSRAATINYGSVTGSPSAGTTLPDLAVAGTDVTVKAGFFEFSNAVDFLDPPTNIDCASAYDFTSLINTTTPYDASFFTEMIPTDNVQPTGASLSAAAGWYHPVWLKFNAPSTGTIRFETYPQPGDATTSFQNSGITHINDTVISVYTGTCGALTQVAVARGNSGDGAKLTMAVTSGTTYHFRAASQAVGGGEIPIHIRYVAAPANDNFANAIDITSLPYSADVDTTLATLEVNEELTLNDYWPATVANSVWWKITPDTDIVLRINLEGSSTQHQITVWTGSTVDALTEVSSHAYGPTGLEMANMVVKLAAGVTHYIQITAQAQGTGDNEGGSLLHIEVTEETSAPANIECATAIDLSASFIADFTNALNRQFGVTPPGDLWYVGKPLWYTWTADGNGTVGLALDTGVSLDYGLHMQVYTGSCGSLTPVASATYLYTATNGVEWTAVAGTTYTILVVSEYSAEQSVALVFGGAGVVVPPPEPGQGSFRYTIDATEYENVFGTCLNPGGFTSVWKPVSNFTIGSLPNFPSIPAGKKIKKVRLWLGYVHQAYGPANCNYGLPGAINYSYPWSPSIQPRMYFIKGGTYVIRTPIGSIDVGRFDPTPYHNRVPDPDVEFFHSDPDAGSIDFSWWMKHSNLNVTETHGGNSTSEQNASNPVPNFTYGPQGNSGSWDTTGKKYLTGDLVVDPFVEAGEIDPDDFLTWSVGWDLYQYRYNYDDSMTDAGPPQVWDSDPIHAAQVRVRQFSIDVEWAEPEFESWQNPFPVTPGSGCTCRCPCPPTSPTPRTTPTPGNPGDVLDQEDPGYFDMECIGPGTVPTAADPVDAESWVS